METEGAVGAAVQPPVEAPTASTTAAAEPTQKEAGKLRKFFNFLSGKNHEHPAQLHEELQAKKDGASQAELAAPGATPTPDNTSPDIVPGIAAPTAVTPSSESAPNSPDLATIGSTNGAQPAESQTPTGGVDAMINKLQENVEKDSTEDEATQQPASEPARPAAAQDTGAALDAMTASLAKMPEADSSTAEPDVAPKDEEPAKSPAPTIPTGTLASAPITPVQTADPVTEAPIGIKSAAATTAVPSESPSNVVTFQDAAARIQGAKDQTNPDVLTTNPAPTEQPTAPTTSLPKVA